MSLPSAPRRGGDRPRPVHFQYLKGFFAGSTMYGYAAGPALWLYIHPSDLGSKPCLTELTNGELSCVLCKPRGKPVLKGAFPFWSAVDWAPLWVWLDEADRDNIDAIRLHTRVKLGRERADGAPVWVQKCVGQEPKYVSTLPERMRPFDMTETLLKSFKLPELVMWYRHTHGISDNALSQEAQPDATKGDVPPAVAARKTKGKASYREYLDQIGNGGIVPPVGLNGKPSTNGQHTNGEG